jgi:hypothetical protein
MHINFPGIRFALCLGLIAVLAGFGDQALLMIPGTRLHPSADYALVTFVSASGGSASLDPLRGATEIWDGDNLVGMLAPHQFLQYQAATGEHIFVLYNRTMGGIKAHLAAGRSYYVNVGRGLFVGVGVKAIKPDDAQIGPMLDSLQQVALDANAWTARVQTYQCNIMAIRKPAPKLCQIVEGVRANDILIVRNEYCEPHPFDSLQTTCKYLAIEPDDGR